MTSIIQQSLKTGQHILAKRSGDFRKTYGQFLTPEPLARFMAQQLDTIKNNDRILDPAMGSGTLLCAIIERLISENKPVEVWIDGFELDEELFTAAQSILNEAVKCAVKHGIQIYLNLFHTDFILNGLQFLRPTLLDIPVGYCCYQHIIANPPYFKINTTNIHRQMAEGILSGHTNIYTLFMGLVTRMLHNGTACFIVPRSFCSGSYFTRFRQEFIETVTVQHIHVFESRSDAFSQDEVLQENLIITFTPQNEVNDLPVKISSAATLDELANGITSRQITKTQFISPVGLFRLPTSELDETILEVVDGWTGSFHAYNLAVSTGPVVAFRAEKYLIYQPNAGPAVPLLWMQHVTSHRLTWPLKPGFRKPQYIQNIFGTKSLLVQNTNYVLLRRFSAKEEQRRLIAAPYLADHFDYELIGLENHLNFIYCRDGEISEATVIGLSALLNSGLIDRYFRISNGNTQVNATELRALPLPPLQVIIAIGQAIMKQVDDVDVDAIVIQSLQNYFLVPTDFPILRETRVV